MLPIAASYAQDNSEQQTQAPPTENTQENPLPSPLGTSDAPVSLEREETVETDWNKPECSEPKNHNEADLCQQRRMADAAEQTVFLSKAQIFLGIVGAGLLFWTLYYSRKATNAAVQSANAMMDAERPHMLVSNLKVAGIRQPPNADGKIKLLVSWRFTNYGRSPAMLRAFGLSRAIVDELPLPPDEFQMSQSRFITGVGGWYGSGEPSEIVITQQTAAQILEKKVKLWLLAKMEYRDTFGRTHITRVAYRMSFAEGDESERYHPDGPDAYWEYS